MEEIIALGNRGKLELKNSNVKCFLGNDQNYKSSEEIYKELKFKKIIGTKNFYSIDKENYLIYYPIPEKKISIITNIGKIYKSVVYFVDDIKNIINGLKIINPCYLIKDEYIPFKKEKDYANFLYEKNTNEIKGIETEKIDYIKLKKSYNSFQIKKSDILGNINKNIFLYSKIDKIEKEEYFMTIPRTSLNIKLDCFYENNNRNDVDDVIYGIFGNYASGKSFFLIYYNYEIEFPSVYLNLKALKNAHKTKGFSDLLNNELMILFFKLKKSYKEYENFIKSFLPYENQELDKLIISIIEKIKNEPAIIILDQYQEKIFKDKDFIKKLKKLLFNEDSKIKLIISSSINDGPVRKAYLNIFLTSIKNKEEENERAKEEIDNKTNNFIPYHFLDRLVDIDDIQEIKKEINENDDEKAFNDCLKLFNYLPLYYTLCKQYKNNLDNFVELTKQRIEDKILKINKDDKINLKYFDSIRKMIDNEITVDDLEIYSEYIPFKYFYIEQNDTKLFLRTHFPLVKDVWNRIIMKETVDLFDGEINYDGNVIGSLLELNIIINIKNKIIPLDIDSFVKVDTIYNFEKIIESDTNDFQNKNIFITQNNQNGPYYDIAYIEGKNINSPKLTFIQVKKSLSDNKIDKQNMYIKFEEKKNKFLNLFNFIPERENINLVYISLINNQIRQAILSHDNYKKDKSKKVSDLGYAINYLIYSVNKLYNFCFQNGIQLFYYEPKTHKFYIKNNNNFEPSKLVLSVENKNKNELNYIFNISYLSDELENNKINCTNINITYQNFLKKKRRNSFSYIINEFDFNIVFEFTEKYFKNAKIINYIDLHKAHSDCQYYNLLKNQAIICIKINKKGEYEVISFIYNDRLIKFEKGNLKLEINNKLDRENDFLVAISFDSINEQLKLFLSSNL